MICFPCMVSFHSKLMAACIYKVCMVYGGDIDDYDN